MFANWDELRSAANGEKRDARGDPALQILVRLIQERGREVLNMCRRLQSCVEQPTSAQVAVSTVHKAKGLEWPKVFVSGDFNQFVTIEAGQIRHQAEEAFVMYVALTRAKEKVVLHPDSVEAIQMSSDAKAGIQPGRESDSPRLESERDQGRSGVRASGIGVRVGRNGKKAIHRRIGDERLAKPRFLHQSSFTAQAVSKNTRVKRLEWNAKLGRMVLVERRLPVRHAVESDRGKES